MKIKVLVTDPIDEEGIRRLEERGFEVVVKDGLPEEELKEIIPDYDALIVRSRTKVTREVIKCGKRLRVIGRAGTGLDNVDIESAREARITLVNTPEALATAVAQLAIGFVLCLARSIPLADRSMKEGKWIKRELQGWELRGKILGLVGFGNIGIEVARIAKSLGMSILMTKRTRPSEKLLRRIGVEFVTLDDLLKKSDIVSLHVPFTRETHRMIGERELNLMKHGAFLINTSRGGVVDEDALFRALLSGKLSGAALDVYESEPPTDSRLIGLPNVVCTPHIGAQTREAQRDASIKLAEKIASFFSEENIGERQT